MPTLAAVTTFADTEALSLRTCLTLLTVPPAAVMALNEPSRWALLEDRLGRRLLRVEREALANALHASIWQTSVDGFHTPTREDRPSTLTEAKRRWLREGGFDFAEVESLLASGFVDYPSEILSFQGDERRQTAGLNEQDVRILERYLNHGYYRTFSPQRQQGYRPLSGEEQVIARTILARLPRFAGTCYVQPTGAVMAALTAAGPGARLELPEDLTCVGRSDRMEGRTLGNSVLVEIFTVGGQGRRVEDFSFWSLDRPAWFSQGSTFVLRGRRIDSLGNQVIQLQDSL